MSALVPRRIALAGFGSSALAIAFSGFTLGGEGSVDGARGSRPPDATQPMRLPLARPSRRLLDDEELMLIVTAAMHVLQ